MLDCVGDGAEAGDGEVEFFDGDFLEDFVRVVGLAALVGCAFEMWLFVVVVVDDVVVVGCGFVGVIGIIIVMAADFKDGTVACGEIEQLNCPVMVRRPRFVQLADQDVEAEARGVDG